MHGLKLPLSVQSTTCSVQPPEHTYVTCTCRPTLLIYRSLRLCRDCGVHDALDLYLLCICYFSYRVGACYYEPDFRESMSIRKIKNHIRERVSHSMHRIACPRDMHACRQYVVSFPGCTNHIIIYPRARGGWNVNLLTCVLRKQSMRGM